MELDKQTDIAWGWVGGNGMQEQDIWWINRSERRVSNIGRGKGNGSLVRWC